MSHVHVEKLHVLLHYSDFAIAQNEHQPQISFHTTNFYTVCF